MKNSKKINLASLANDEISRQQLMDVKGGHLFPCACFRQGDLNRSEGNRRNVKCPQEQ
jgi:natural product precursor